MGEGGGGQMHSTHTFDFCLFIYTRTICVHKYVRTCVRACARTSARCVARQGKETSANRCLVRLHL